MRTIKQSLFNRLNVQVEEAECQGKHSLASSLTNQIEKQASMVRPNDQFYLYAAEDFTQDLEDHFWSALIRVADFHDVGFDAEAVKELIAHNAETFLHDVRVKLGVATSVGAFEADLPGEREKTILTISEEP